MKKIVLFFLLLLAILLNSCGGLPGQEDLSAPAPGRLTVRVLRIVDGDTLLIELENKKQERARMIGIDTPETKKAGTPVQRYGPEASAYTKKNLDGKTVFLELDVGERDKYGRLLIYVWRDRKENDPRKMFNSELLLKGYARTLTIPPNVKYADTFTQYQTEARKNRAGLWK